MKSAVKVCAKIIRQNFDFWNDKQFIPRLLDEIRTTGLNNYGMISVMYVEKCLTFREFKRLERYNERLQTVYLYQQH